MRAEGVWSETTPKKELGLTTQEKNGARGLDNS
jgi:hypothetical protein